ncbi:PP2C family serine/threonine-protein phosphatase [Caballeronia sp. SBC2]|uniref:PP2C family serine/threonine-protein phosphatase n=1 Tax=Caballeronia sp. SBC2 TaxID=2705547 RepID=UPI0013E16985|nr:PP2C family serine/threonine-protein phosphatase [Caballeronia sp. SBC2]QIE30196.1 Protein phosphatase 2C [Caballeronia sp. SBC2]
MTLWKSFGASVCGPGHVATGKPNQDAWASFHRAWGDGIVISDGLGSKPFADVGSEAVCRAVVRAADACRDKTEIDYDFLSDGIKTNWLSLISPLEPRDCAATCLFALRLGDGVIRLGMLGDGLAAAITDSGSIVQLSEDKSQGFSNITTALSPNASTKDWRYLSLPEHECSAVLLCTDGVADDLDDVGGFAKEFVDAHRNLSVVSANRHVREMLENWPTPKHSDDKTIACLCREAQGYE